MHPIESLADAYGIAVGEQRRWLSKDPAMKHVVT